MLGIGFQLHVGPGLGNAWTSCGPLGSMVPHQASVCAFVGGVQGPTVQGKWGPLVGLHLSKACSLCCQSPVLGCAW